MQIKSIQPMAAKILAEETGKMIIATKQLFYAMEVHKLLHFQNADMSAVSFAMTVHGLMDYELDLRSGECKTENQERNNLDEYLQWFCGDQTIKSRGQNKYRSQLLHGMQNGGISVLIAE